jgi:hypothetical protein
MKQYFILADGSVSVSNDNAEVAEANREWLD